MCIFVLAEKDMMASKFLRDTLSANAMSGNIGPLYFSFLWVRVRFKFMVKVRVKGRFVMVMVMVRVRV